MNKILKSTVRGQITLPKEWRDAHGTDHYRVQIEKNTLILVPLHLDSAEDEEVIFDADRDNDGKGISLDSMISMLTKIIDEQD